MHGTVGAAAKPVEQKTRTITLTNRAPIQIVEADWPVIAQGASGSNWEAPWGWKVEFRVRQHKEHDWRYIIHANYLCYDETSDDNENDQTVRVGRIESLNHTTKKGTVSYQLWQHIKAVAEELRERIENEKLRKHVTYAVDACFAKLPPQSA